MLGEFWSDFRYRLRSVFRRDDLEQDLDAELRFHLEREAEKYIAQGVARHEARRRARVAFGGLDQIKEDTRDARGTRLFEDLRRDLGYGARSLLRAPLFSLLAIVTLAVGIGANAAVFGVAKSVLLDALPYMDADRLVRVYGRFLDGTDDRAPLSAGMVSDIAERQRSFERVASFSTTTPDVVYGDDSGPHIAPAAWVEPGFFRTLGVAVALGRAFSDSDAQDTARVVVLTHSAWQRLFGGDSGALGRDARINGFPRTVVGVLPRDFVGPVGEADIYFPLSLASTLRDPVRARRTGWLGLVGRLKPGVTREAAQRELTAIATDLAREHPEAGGGIGLATIPLRDAMVGDTRMQLLVLMASAGLVLLITCANLAGALLSRTLSRRKAFAVRAALGAGRGRVIRQLLTESALLSLAGGAGGLFLAMLGLAAVRDLAVPMIPVYANLSLDAGAVLVMGLVALCTGLGFGMAPRSRSVARPRS